MSAHERLRSLHGRQLLLFCVFRDVFSCGFCLCVIGSDLSASYILACVLGLADRAGFDVADDDAELSVGVYRDLIKP